MAQSSSANTVQPLGVAAARARILLIEDEPTVADILVEVLEGEGYEVASAATGRTGGLLLEEVKPDLVMMDLILPDVDGLLLCSQLRARTSAPIVILSGSKRHRDRILSLRLGADDFIAKPFDLNELVARVAAILRRTAHSGPGSGHPESRVRPPAYGSWRVGGADPLPDAAGNPDVYRVGELVIDHGRRSVTIAGAPVHLTRTENRLLSTLASEPERVFTREDLAHAIWGFKATGESRAVDVHIRRLRAKLEPFGASAPAIVTVRGFGYRLT